MKISARAGRQSLPTRDVLAVFDKKNLRERAAANLLLERSLTIERDLQQLVIDVELTAGRHPTPVRRQRALLHADSRQQHIEVGLADCEPSVGAPKTAIIDVAIAQQREQHADLELTAVVCVVGVLVNRKVTVGETVACVDTAAERPEVLAHAAVDGTAVVEPGRTARSVGTEDQIECTLGFE